MFIQHIFVYATAKAKVKQNLAVITESPVDYVHENTLNYFEMVCYNAQPARKKNGIDNLAKTGVCLNRLS